MLHIVNNIDHTSFTRPPNGISSPDGPGAAVFDPLFMRGLILLLVARREKFSWHCLSLVAGLYGCSRSADGCSRVDNGG